MARRLVLAVAGSGKTALLIDQLDEVRRHLVIAYTTSNVAALQKRVVQRFGYCPPNITVLSYFAFLHSFCYRPFLKMKHRSVGIKFEPCSNRFATGLARFVDQNGRVYSNRLAKLLEFENIIPDVIRRIDKYFDQVLFDEFQDFSGHDFDLIEALAPLQARQLYVGDFFQHTFATSLDGAVNRRLHESQSGFIRKCVDIGMIVDQSSLARSHRCSPTVCEFVTNRLGIQIQSHRTDPTEVRLITHHDEAQQLFADGTVVKLFFKESYRFPCFAKNWGDCKGDDHFGSVCVVLNPGSMTAYNNGTLATLAAQTRNKLYVACTRARGNLYFVAESFFTALKTS